MPIQPNCPECQRLWESYSLAIREDIRLEYQLRAATLEGDLATIQLIVEEVDAADLVRQNLRDSIRRHEVQAHGNGARAG